MACMAVLVTGVPGSGKSTLARQLAPALEVPLLSLDVIKESLFDSLGVRDREWAGRVRHSSLEVIWSVLPDCPGGAVIDLWLDPSRDQGAVQDGLARAGLGCVLEVLCELPGEEAARRYASRDRHPGHLSADEATLTRIKDAAELMAPLGLGPALEVDTTTAVNVDVVTTWIRQHAGSRW